MEHKGRGCKIGWVLWKGAARLSPCLIGHTASFLLSATRLAHRGRARQARYTYSMGRSKAAKKGCGSTWPPYAGQIDAECLTCLQCLLAVPAPKIGGG